MASEDPEEFSGNLAKQSIAAGDPTGWFERLYAAAEAGETEVPWDRHAPSQFLVQWAEQRGLAGAGQRALVVGCGLGEDAEFIAGLGYTTVAFDISPTAIAAARRRFPDSAVEYRVANLLDPPPGVAPRVRPGGGEPHPAGAVRSAAARRHRQGR